MGQVLAFNTTHKARYASMKHTEEQSSGEVRAKLSRWVAELSAAIADLENNLVTLNAHMVLLPPNPSTLDLESSRIEIVVTIDKGRRILAEVDQHIQLARPGKITDMKMKPTLPTCSDCQRLLTPTGQIELPFKCSFCGEISRSMEEILHSLRQKYVDQ